MLVRVPRLAVVWLDSVMANLLLCAVGCWRRFVRSRGLLPWLIRYGNLLARLMQLPRKTEGSADSACV